MQKQVIHRLYTEDKNRQAVTDILAKQLESFTVIEAVAAWRGVPERSLIVEVIGVSFADMQKVATAIKEANSQDAVLYTAHEIKTKLF